MVTRFIQTLDSSSCKLVAACQNWEPVRLAEKVILREFFLSVLIKAHNYYRESPGPGIMEFCSWKCFIMWSMPYFVVQRKRVLRSSWILNECNLSCKLVENCRISIVVKRTNSVRGLYDKKNQRLTVLFTSGVMKKSILKRLVCTPPDLSPRL